MKKLFLILSFFLLLSHLSHAQGPARRRQPLTVASSGSTACGAGSQSCRVVGSCKFSGTSSCTTGTIVLNSGETLVGWTGTPGLPATVNLVWNSLSLTEVGTGGSIGSVESHLAHKDNVTGASATATCTDSTSANISTGICQFIAITGSNAAPFDSADTHTTGNTTTPGTTTTSPTVQPGLALFLIAEQQNTTATAGSWVGPATQITSIRDGNASGSCCVTDAGWQTYSVTTGQNGAMTGVATGNWVSWLVLLKR